MSNIFLDDFKSGVIKDKAPSLIPDDAVVDAWNVLFDYGSGGGKIRRRNAAKLCQAIDHGVYPGSIGHYDSESVDGARGIIGARATFNSFDVSLISENGSLAYGSIATNVLEIGRAFNYFDNLCIPVKSKAAVPLMVTYGGSRWPFGFTLSGAVAFGTPATAVVTSGDPKIPIAVADMDIVSTGMYITLSNATAGYIGRITNVGNNFIEVSPTPNFTFTPTGGGPCDSFANVASGNQHISGAGCGTTHQGRVLLGNLMTGITANKIQDLPSYLAWGFLPDETAVSGAISWRGLHNLISIGFNEYNRFPIADIGVIVGMESISDDEVLILGSNGIYVLNGSLPTLTVEGGSITFDTRQVSRTVNCINDSTIKRVTGGVAFANKDSVWMYDGSSIVDLMGGKIKNFYKSITNKSNIEIQGAAYIDNKYYMLSTNDRCFVFSFDTGAWSFFDNMEFSSSTNDRRSNKVFAARAANAGYNSSAEELFRLDTIFDENELFSADYNYREIETYVKTKSYSFESIINKHFKHVSALTQLKKTDKYNSINFNNKLGDVLDLPNADCEQGSTAFWHGASATPESLVADNTTGVARTGKYAIRVDTTGNNQGARYYLPSMWLNTTDTIGIEIWVWAGAGTPTATLTLGKTGDTVTTTITANQSWQVMRLCWSPASSANHFGIYVQVTLSTTTDLFLDDLSGMVFGQLQRFSGSNNITNGSTLVPDSIAADDDFCLRVTTTAASIGQGVTYKVPFIKIPKNARLRIRVKLKNETAATPINVTISYGGQSDGTTTAFTPGTTAFRECLVDGAKATATRTGAEISISTTTAIARIIYIQEISYYIEDFGAGINFVGGVNGEGSIGDGVLVDDFSSDTDFDDDYSIDSGSGLTKVGGILDPTSTGVKWVRSKRSRNLRFNSGEVGAKINIGSWATEAEGPSLLMLLRASSDGDAYAGGIIQDDIAIYQYATLTGTEKNDNNAIITPASYKDYWIRFKLRGRKAIVHLYDVDPNKYNRFYLDKYTAIEEGRVEYVYDAVGELDSDLAGMRIELLTSNSLDEEYDDFYIMPFDNIQLKEDNENESTLDRYSFYLISQAGAFEFRSWGGSDFNVFGIGFNVETLNSEREN